MFKSSRPSLPISPRLLSCIIALSTANVALLYLVKKFKYAPAALEKVTVHSPPDAPQIRRGQKITVLTWNLQFMARNKRAHFFYDGGNDPWPSKKTIMSTIGESADLIRECNPDILILQELAKGSVTSQFVNEIKKLKKRLPKEYSSYVSAYYLRSRFIPHPKVLGPSYLKLVIISKYKITDATRYALPSLDSFDLLSRWLGHLFGFKRAILEAVMPIEGGSKLHVFNTHFSAFSHGSDILQQQADRAHELLSGLPMGDEGVLAGDLNCVMSHDVDFSSSPLDSLFRSFVSTPSKEVLKSESWQQWGTFFPCYPNRNHGKTLDFMFFTSGLRLGGSRIVDREKSIMLSDHLPLATEVVLT